MTLVSSRKCVGGRSSALDPAEGVYSTLRPLGLIQVGRFAAGKGKEWRERVGEWGVKGIRREEKGKAGKVRGRGRGRKGSVMSNIAQTILLKIHRRLVS